MKNLTFFLLIIIAMALASCSDQNPVLTIEGGKIIGVPTATEGVIAYKGIPFAAPPVGDLRWKEPQPVVPWEGIKTADTYGDAASQTTWDPESFYGREWRASGSVPFTEDCLYLNVWTPAAGKKGKKLPVAMWIHGGGYREGFAYEPEMDGGEDYASRGVILVQVTYRLGSMGFFSHPLLSAESPNGVSGNYGLLDQAAALKWIRNNIEQFGGDPDNIMIFGQSAGAGSVQSLCASPLSKGMIKKAVIMSGGGLTDSRPGMSLDTAQLANKKMMDYFNKTTLAEMRALTFEELRQMSADYTAATKKRVMWSPIIDNYFSTGTFSDVARAGQLADIPYMIGFTSNDLSDMTKPVTDFCMLRSEQSDKPAYAYLFTRQLPGDSSGAFHSSDLWYVFHAFRHSWRPFTEGDKELSLKMVDFWTNFAKYGDPNGKENDLWTPCTPDSPRFMVFDANEEKALLVVTDSPKYLGGTYPR
ncbi:MAG: carboxylesterase family protein [Bacteroidales bacterium]|jgi:para-nitrobenzyl esterase|nr:carboxylesterase family protein [Bacteroidales bacterium]OQB60585.1 MAG: Fumonisin B1 esterase [Bacteroidetes bacterium ADurb.Bin145]HOU02492.1 carboxylesterase family protein [Bacteroidales bacterium]HQK68682.1 carboxylesterase family protein [Bacteroidales bacterium]